MQNISRTIQYLKWMLEAINTIEQYLGKENSSILESDNLRLDACLMQLIHIGEIMNKLVKHNPNFKLPGIEAHRVIGLRNFAAHDYLGLNIRLVQRIIAVNLPELKKTIVSSLDNIKE